VLLGSRTVNDMPPHAHPGKGFKDLDVSDRPDLRDWHVAFRFGAVGEEPMDALAPFIPLSLSFSERKVPAEMRTVKYGLVRDFWLNMDEPSEEDRQALLRAALSRLASDISRYQAGDESVLTTRYFVRPS
jgi:hypothetical protein